ncbi:MAG TPA: DUF3145 domain-containing protein [Candidatus Agrococcus pullicola]|uniref:DUF3145 domain-containing protein n=1 Tax=Candidatus Agrococcus pullicola TaxID=2838429 RepID=A0A9D1YU19_9MICO|nr:DUF3145 domain-containing protein [Candidatus Agrococcus pullicola]
MARGMVTIHAAQRALHLHLEWAIGRALGGFSEGFDLDWEAQPAEAGTYRATSEWEGPQGAGAMLASALREWSIPFEVTEESESGHGIHYMVTPELGLFTGRTDAAGSVLVDEHRIHVAFAKYAGDAEALAEEFGRLLGVPWDAALEPMRHAQDLSRAVWMHRAG